MVDLRAQGLGRYLASFLRGAQARQDITFVIVCPSWSRSMLEQLFESEGMTREKVCIVSPTGKPHLLLIYEAYQAFRKRPRFAGWGKRVAAVVEGLRKRLLHRLEQRAAQAHDVSSLLRLLVEGGGLLLVAGPFWILTLIARWGKMLQRLGKTRLMGSLQGWRLRLASLLANPKEDGWVLRLFEVMQETETQRMQTLIEGLNEVKAWYCPAAYWPAFNKIKAPRLMCVPDVVLTDFPTGFSRVGGDRFLNTFETIEKAIRNAEHMVTYSEGIKWKTLVDRYAVAPSKVHVVQHAPNELDSWISISDFPNAEATSRHYCQTLLLSALQKSSNPGYAADLPNRQMKFLFYASQFRPNKNILTLIKAYEFLLRRRYIGHKLILTGDPGRMPEIKRFIVDHHLENDVLCLYGLSVSELAACYKLADLAVNPSLSEGGCPFTFTEALSVGTPVVMARINVTAEILYETELQGTTFFDPYDWEDMARRIEWALNNRDYLLEIQNQVFRRLKQRTWADVANEHIAILERISELFASSS